MALYFATAGFKEAEVCVLGAGLDRTVSFSPGTRFGPEQIRVAMETIESYSPYHNRDLAGVRVCDLGDLHLTHESIEETLGQIERKAGEVLDAGKKLVVLGGEHTITVPIVTALKNFYSGLRVVQFDAHADLRDRYLGERYSHATAMRRVMELVGAGRLFQLGIRSFAPEERWFNRNLHPFEILKFIPALKQKIGRAPAYLTIDIDVLDCGSMAAVGTPEPGGVSYRELLQALVELRTVNWVGADIVEFNPAAAPQPAYGCVAAGLLRETILMITNKKRKHRWKPRYNERRRAVRPATMGLHQ